MIAQRQRAVWFAVLLATIVPATAPWAQAAPVYDVVIRNGRVLDGAGNPWILADVAIKDGRFVRIGRVTGRGRREIDARGKYVSPGWIDMMDQSGGVLPRNGLRREQAAQGVTTAIGGEGGTPVPAAGIPEYFAELEQQGHQHQLRHVLQRNAGARRPCSARRVARLTPRSSIACARSWTRRCARARWA